MQVQSISYYKSLCHMKALFQALKDFASSEPYLKPNTGDQEIENISYMIDCFQVIVSRQVQSTNY